MSTSNEKGFTLIDLLFFLAIGGIILGFLLSALGFLSWSPIRPEKRIQVAEENLAVFAAKNGLNPGSCTSSDSDRDGNVSCATTNGQGEQTTVFCPYQIGPLANKGCKLPAVDQLVRPRIQQ